MIRSSRCDSGATGQEAGACLSAHGGDDERDVSRKATTRALPWCSRPPSTTGRRPTRVGSPPPQARENERSAGRHPARPGPGGEPTRERDGKGGHGAHQPRHAVPHRIAIHQQ
ncbi:hypothetical protein B296_00037728 [Ensete ventricosum]|uniref:Uncharacterized protein n=1 Tax=Ensete ventricosum TaxID=4639 RepID=A0A426ZYN5_ENSVE|nr:hypothetical protein B296_00037728 [Ensete ventricosum]